MVNRLWMPVLASMALLLSACGDSQEEANVSPEETPATLTEEEGAATPEAAQDDGEDEVPDPQDLSMWLEVDGKRYQDGSTKTMVFGVAELVAY